MLYFRNLKSWCAVNKENTTLICMGNKAKIPVDQSGEPEAAMSHMQNAWTAEGVTLIITGII